MGSLFVYKSCIASTAPFKQNVREKNELISGPITSALFQSKIFGVFVVRFEI